MKITFDIPNRLIDNDLGYVDVRFHKDGIYINKVTTCDYEHPYFAELPFSVQDCLFCKHYEVRNDVDRCYNCIKGNTNGYESSVTIKR